MSIRLTSLSVVLYISDHGKYSCRSRATDKSGDFQLLQQQHGWWDPFIHWKDDFIVGIVCEQHGVDWDDSYRNRRKFFNNLWNMMRKTAKSCLMDYTKCSRTDWFLFWVHLAAFDKVNSFTCRLQWNARDYSKWNCEHRCTQRINDW